MDQFEVIVVGAGVSGLAAARRLSELGRRVLLVDASEEIGGRVGSDRVDGYVLDRGFQVLPTTYARTHALSGDLGARSFSCGAEVWDGKAFRSVFDPRRSPSKILATLTSGVFTFRDLRLLFKLWRCKFRLGEGTTNEKLDEIGFSKTAIELFFRPFLSGIFLETSLCTSSRFFTFSLDHFSRGRATLPRDGMKAVADAIAGRSPATRRTNQVVRILEDGVLYSDGTIDRSSAVILATDATSAARLVNLPGDAAWRSCTTLYFCSETSSIKSRAIHLNGSGSGIVNSVAFLSNVQPAYAPTGKSLVAVTVIGHTDVPSDVLSNIVKNELCRWFPIEVPSWRFLRGYGLERALPICRTIPSLKWRLPRYVFLAGDWFDVPSIEHAVVSGIEAAESVHHFITENPLPSSATRSIKHLLEEHFARGSLDFDRLPTFREQRSDGTYFIFDDAQGFHLVANERGEELSRDTFDNESKFFEFVIAKLSKR